MQSSTQVLLSGAHLVVRTLLCIHLIPLYSQVPRDVSDAIYGRVRGAVYDVKEEIWTIPCGQYLNISLQFGGLSYPVHPLDTVDDNFNRVDAQGNRICIGAVRMLLSFFLFSTKVK